jgi:CRP-like cAMP-binding protein
MSELLIKHINIHVVLTDQQQRLVLSKFKKVTLKKNSYLLRTGEVCRYESFVTKGCLKVYSLDEAGTEHIVFFAVEDWYVGDLYSFLTGLPATLNIVALENTEILQIDKKALDDLLTEVPPMERYFRLLFQNAYIASQTRISESISNNAVERYELFIKRYPKLLQRLPHYLVASYLGITPQFLSKIRKTI